MESNPGCMIKTFAACGYTCSATWLFVGGYSFSRALDGDPASISMYQSAYIGLVALAIAAGTAQVAKHTRNLTKTIDGKVHDAGGQSRGPPQNALNRQASNSVE